MPVAYSPDLRHRVIKARLAKVHLYLGVLNYLQES